MEVDYGQGGIGNKSTHNIILWSDDNSSNSDISKEEMERLINEFVGVTNFNFVTQVILIVAFAVLIIIGATGNGLVCYVVARNPHMRTPRNIFIINLAISDLSLCLFTQPFNLMKVSMRIWKLGNFMCKFVPMFSGTNVFVSTISITAIALDRFQVIVYPTKDNAKKLGAITALLSIWTISLLMASPMVIFNVTQAIEVWEGEVLYKVCVENPYLHYEKGAYSIASMIFQYFVPIIIVTVAHAKICNKLKYRMANRPRQLHTATSHSPFLLRKQEAEKKRKRKTNLLLIFIAVVFACSWMPLNVFNILADFDHKTYKLLDKNNLIFPICHLLVLSSACTNPMLYGWLNDNFRKEFAKVFTCRSNGAAGRDNNTERDTHHRDNQHSCVDGATNTQASHTLLECNLSKSSGHKNETRSNENGLTLDVPHNTVNANSSFSVTSIN